jgi:hypothetical protein
MNEIDRTIIKAIESEIYKLTKEQQTECDRIYNMIEMEINMFGLPAMLAVALVSAKKSSEE